MTTIIPKYPNQGQAIVLGWDNVATLKNWTAYQGTDGVNFLPPSDRTGYSDGEDRNMPTGTILMAGIPVSRQTFPWISEGQITYLLNTFDNQNVTVAIHKPSSIGQMGTSNYNAVLTVDINQFSSLTRMRNGYELFVARLVLVEPL